jgi:hypothetical protein
MTATENPRPLQTHLVREGNLSRSGYFDGRTIRALVDGRVLAKQDGRGRWPAGVIERREGPDPYAENIRRGYTFAK